jgi:hypothetical protein
MIFRLEAAVSLAEGCIFFGMPLTASVIMKSYCTKLWATCVRWRVHDVLEVAVRWCCVVLWWAPASMQVPDALTPPAAAAAEGHGAPSPATTSSVSAVEGARLRPGLAMSQDGRSWARIEGDHHSGALFDVGGPGEWDELMVGRPQVSLKAACIFIEAQEQQMADRTVLAVATSIGEEGTYIQTSDLEFM